MPWIKNGLKNERLKTHVEKTYLARRLYKGLNIGLGNSESSANTGVYKIFGG